VRYQDIQLQPAAQIEVNVGWNVDARPTGSYPRSLDSLFFPKLSSGQRDRYARAKRPDDCRDSTRSQHRERLLGCDGTADSLKAMWHSAMSEFTYEFHGVVKRRIDEIGRAEELREFELAFRCINRDDARGPSDNRALYAIEADATAADHGNCAAYLRFRHVENRA
jgi:hypothetical protein